VHDLESQRVVLVSTGAVGPLMRASIESACTAARARCVDWSADRALPPGLKPALVVSTLPLGERRIPDEIVRLMTHDHPGLPLLLLCTDELIRPTVSLQEGRVTLLGPPMTAERIGARIRILLADISTDSSIGTLPFGLGAQPSLLVREQSNSRFYFGFTATAAADGAQFVAPLVEQVEGGALTVYLNVDAPLSPGQLTRAASVLNSDEGDDAKEEVLLDSIGPAGAVVHCSASSEWLVHWPASTAGLFVASAARLPQFWNVSNSLGRTDSTCWRLQGLTGDVLIALWGTPWPGSVVDEPRLLDAALAGGPRVLDLLVELTKGIDQRAVALVMEIR
jgi:hypothetical protein